MMNGAVATSPGNPHDRGGILNEAIQLTYGPRSAEYGDVVENHRGIGRLWQAYLESVCMGKMAHEMPFSLTPEDVAHMMLLLKMQRSANVPHVMHHDNYPDMAAYAAIAGECAYAVRLGENEKMKDVECPQSDRWTTNHGEREGRP